MPKILQIETRAKNRNQNDIKYYIEGQKLHNSPYYNRVLFGNLIDLAHEPATYHLLKNGIDSKYCGWVFQVGHHNEEWTINKDAYFYAGAIEAHKKFQLITDINYCINGEIIKFNNFMKMHGEYFKIHPTHCMERTDIVGVTFREILWMLDNGYSYRVSERNHLETVFEPPFRRKGCVKIINYDPRFWSPNKWTEQVINRLLEVQENVNIQRNNMKINN